MNSVLQEVLVDLDAEGGRLERLVSGLDEAGWQRPTPAAGWSVKHQIAHLAWTDEAATAAATDPVAWDALVSAAIANPDGFVDDSAAEGTTAEAAQLLNRWRRSRAALREALRGRPAGQKMPWYGPPMSPTSMATARFMETWAHGLDVAETLGELPEPTDAIRHIVHLGVRTRNYAFAVHGLPVPSEDFRFSLVAPSGSRWETGSRSAAQAVRGSAYDFCLLVAQRRNRADLDLIADGADADRWLDIAQAFAGPAGSGRGAADE
ncbi:MAG: TIGR03084 family metal-binding protein [Actinomycetota bacterium]|nr:TIGR03084 family metal-binding protein [Actinomycetota bacterium]